MPRTHNQKKNRKKTTAAELASPTIDQELETYKILREELNKRKEKIAQAHPGIDQNGNLIDRNKGLLQFIRYFWDVLEPETKLVEGWCMDAVCQHLEAVTLGKLTRLLINIPPGFQKSLITNVWWPAWEWGPMGMAHLRYVSFSYSSGLTERDNTKFRTLVSSPKYKDLWGDQFDLEKEGEIRITNTKTGFKFASSVKGIGTGERGDRVVLDDPHSVQQSESDIIRNDTIRWFRETMTNRLNDAERSAIVIIMQRVHQADVSGYILENNPEGYCHLRIPMRYESGWLANNQLGWTDPRTKEGELAWPERFPESTVDRDEAEMGTWATAAQHQQRPSPRGGGLIQYEKWRQYDPDNAITHFGTEWPNWPPFSFVIFSVDTAQTEKKLNDPSAGVLLGVCKDIQTGRNQVMLMHAWAERLEFFELCNRVEDTCKKWRVHKVLVENKASGLPLVDELRRRGRVFSNRLAHSGKKEHQERADFGIVSIKPEGDKVSRVLSIQNLFEAGVIWAPCDGSGWYKTWAEAVMKELAEMPRGAHDDLADCMSQGLIFLREMGVAMMPDDAQFDDEDQIRYKRNLPPMYPGFT